MIDFEQMTDEQIDNVSRALTHYFFRMGAVENIHIHGNLSNSDMKIINKDMHNRIAGLLVAIKEKRCEDIERLINNYAMYGKDWDICTPYLDDINSTFDFAKFSNPQK